MPDEECRLIASDTDYQKFWAAAKLLVGIVAFTALAGCGKARETCSDYVDWQSSAFVLPYPVGTRHQVSQANCSLGGHQGPYKYSYDFAMPIGTTVTAARSGIVVEMRMKFDNDQRAEWQSNWIKIRHSDMTIAAYSHLNKDGATVKMGDRISAGQSIGLSGNSGRTDGFPHLHFHLSRCSEPVVKDCGTIPVTFRNTAANPFGLRGQQSYAALAFDAAQIEPPPQ